jgi:hypothetical protein
MTADDQFDILLSDDLYAEGLLASDVASLWRRLARTEQVGTVARLLASDRDRIRDLAAYTDKLAKEPCDSKFRHPHDVAICAALVVLHPSPLSPVRHLFDRLRRLKRAPLVWVQRMAEYCDDGFAGSERTSITLGSTGDGVGLALSPSDESPIEWNDDELQRTRHELPLCC